MCGRFALTTPSARLAAAFDLNSIGDLEPRYNIAPTQTIVAVRRGSGKNVLMKVRWGLIPRGPPSRHRPPRSSTPAAKL